MKRLIIKQFVVEGWGEFPLDMLRYDGCWPSTGADALMMDSHRRDNRRITMSTNYPNSPTKGRWASFMWHVREVRE